MTGNHSKYYFSYLNKLIDQYINTYHFYIGKNPVDIDYSVLTGKNNQVIEHLNLKLVIELGLLNIQIFLAKITLRIGQEKYLLLNPCFKLIQ